MMVNSTLGEEKFTDGVPGAAGGAGNMCSACITKFEGVFGHDLSHKIIEGFPEQDFIYIQ